MALLRQFEADYRNSTRRNLLIYMTSYQVVRSFNQVVARSSRAGRTKQNKGMGASLSPFRLRRCRRGNAGGNKPDPLDSVRGCYARSSGR